MVSSYLDDAEGGGWDRHGDSERGYEDRGADGPIYCHSYANINEEFGCYDVKL